MTDIERIGRRVLHAAHVERLQNSTNAQQRQLARMTEEQVWDAANSGQREFALLCARVALQEVRK